MQERQLNDRNEVFESETLGKCLCGKIFIRVNNSSVSVFKDKARYNYPGDSTATNVFRCKCSKVISETFIEIGERKRLKPGNKYIFEGYPQNGFQINAMSFPGTDSDDGGIQGISVKWLTKNGKSYWYAFKSEYDFWGDLRFINAISA